MRLLCLNHELSIQFSPPFMMLMSCLAVDLSLC